MLEHLQVDEELINNEVDRLELLFMKEKYTKEQKLWFIESKINMAKRKKDFLTIKICEKLLNNLDS